MRIASASIALGLVGLAVGVVAAISLYEFFGPEGSNLGIIGIRNAIELVVFPIVSMTVGYVLAGRFFSSGLSPGVRFFRGVGVALCSFLVCIAVYTIIVIVTFKTLSALWLSFAALLFGGLAFAIPGALVAGFVGAAIHVESRATK